ncbi:MAG: hypothetical protein HYS59_00615 [Candidatus Vogelbacteria bacterium]|nr:hypothetical protein [Candidatus Vogelbacteria bacterium]
MFSRREYREYFGKILLPRFTVVIVVAYLLDIELGRVALQCAGFLYCMELIHHAVLEIRASAEKYKAS